MRVTISVGLVTGVTPAEVADPQLLVGYQKLAAQSQSAAESAIADARRDRQDRNRALRSV
jgi:hypothetical protein